MKTVNSILDWFEPLRFRRANWDLYARVRVAYYLSWLMQVLIMLSLAWVVTTGGVGLMVASSVSGFSSIGTEEAIALMAAMACARSGCNGMIVLSSTISFGMCAIALTFLISMFFPPAPLKPETVDEEELTELRAMGYIVMEAEEYDRAILRAIHESAAAGGAGAGGGAGGVQPGQLDSAGAVDRWSIPPVQIYGGAAETD